MPGEAMAGNIHAICRWMRQCTRSLSLLGVVAVAAPQAPLGSTGDAPTMDRRNVVVPVASPFARPTRILILYALAPESPTSAVFLARLRTTLRAELGAPVEFFEEFVDLDRFATPGRWAYFARFYGEKYRGHPPDLVVAIGLVALEFAIGRLRQIMPDVPIVFGMTYAHRVDVAALPAKVTGRTIRMTLGRSLPMARRLQPNADRVVVIAGSSRVDSIALADALADAARERQSIRIEPWQGLPYDSLLRAVRSLTSRTIVYFAYFRRDAHGRTMVPLEALTDVARHSGAPVYGYADAMIGTGVVGGAMWVHDQEAVQTARRAARVLRGGGAAALPPVEEAPVPYMADWRQLRRFGLDERNLIPGTLVLHRAPGAWDRYRKVVLTTIAVVVLQAVLIGMLLVERRRRLHVQNAMADQTRFERLISELTTDAARYAPLPAPGALETALGRIGRFAGADEVVLVQHSGTTSNPPTKVHWRKRNGGATPAHESPDAPAGDTVPFEVPLVVGGRNAGSLTLCRAMGPWPAGLADRLAAAAEVLAAAIAQSAATQRAEEAARQVAHIGRVAVVGELASAISHELRQPLAAILINGEIAKQALARGLDARTVGHIIDDIIADTNRANAMIEHVRSLLRKDAPPRTMVDVNMICAEAADLLRHDAITRGIRLEVSLDSLASPIRGQPIELQQVALNLLLNAFDAVMSGDERWVEIRTTRIEDSAQIVVSDSGPGLSQDARNRVFESFFTTKVHGLGMGLAIVRSIVERHCGRIQVETRERGGATFRVTLPRAEMPAAAAEQPRDFAETR
jgi:C4-dicarboxylate-specific signal transduction histidine kinase